MTPEPNAKAAVDSPAPVREPQAAAGEGGPSPDRGAIRLGHSAPCASQSRHHGPLIAELAAAVATEDRDQVSALPENNKPDKRIAEDHTPSQTPDSQRNLVGQAENRPDAFRDRWLTPAQAAAYVNVCRMTIWRWRYEKGLKFAQVGGVVRIRLTELERFMERHLEH